VVKGDTYGSKESEHSSSSEMISLNNSIVLCERVGNRGKVVYSIKQTRPVYSIIPKNPIQARAGNRKGNSG